MTWPLARLALAAWLAPLAACATAGRAERRPAAALQLVCATRGARVTLDERPLTAAALAAPLQVAPGPHRLTVEAPGHFATYLDVDLTPGAQRRVEVALRPLPDGEVGP